MATVSGMPRWRGNRYFHAAAGRDRLTFKAKFFQRRTEHTLD